MLVATTESHHLETAIDKSTGELVAQFTPSPLLHQPSVNANNSPKFEETQSPRPKGPRYPDRRLATLQRLGIAQLPPLTVPGTAHDDEGTPKDSLTIFIRLGVDHDQAITEVETATSTPQGHVDEQAVRSEQTEERACGRSFTCAFRSG